jgi:hypothetical protein
LRRPRWTATRIKSVYSDLPPYALRAATPNKEDGLWPTYYPHGYPMPYGPGSIIFRFPAPEDDLSQFACLALVGAIRQLADLAKHAENIFGEITTDCEIVFNRYTS